MVGRGQVGIRTGDPRAGSEEDEVGTWDVCCLDFVFGEGEDKFREGTEGSRIAPGLRDGQTCGMRSLEKYE